MAHPSDFLIESEDRFIHNEPCFFASAIKAKALPRAEAQGRGESAHEKALIPSPADRGINKGYCSMKDFPTL
jgi:hypothetical protein